MIWALNTYALGWFATWLVLLRNFARAGRRPTDARDAVLLATVWPLVWPTVALIVLGERIMAFLTVKRQFDEELDVEDAENIRAEGVGGLGSRVGDRPGSHVGVDDAPR